MFVSISLQVLKTCVHKLGYSDYKSAREVGTRMGLNKVPPLEYEITRFVSRLSSSLLPRGFILHFSSFQMPQIEMAGVSTPSFQNH